ncbi:MAG: protein TolA, partial [Burkholderiaceae bacterium]|nr:protein TolA [Burkholderiaceae bacterium]
MPRDSGGLGAGVALSLLVHVALILALAFGLNWRSRLPEAVEAELWAAVPQVAAAREVVPAPAPAPAPKPDPKPVVVQPPPRQLHDAQIAIEQARRAARKLEAEKMRAELERKR